VKTDHKSGIVFGVNMLGEIARLDGDYARANRLHEKCQAISKETGNRRHEAISSANLSYVACREGNYDQAIDCGKKRLWLYRILYRWSI
jgi:tetratricopeptide (TPR) repeat protein